jgi:hypothetical protein
MPQYIDRFRSPILILAIFNGPGAEVSQAIKAVFLLLMPPCPLIGILLIFLCPSNRFISLSDQLRAFLTVEALGDRKAARLYTVAGTKVKFFKTISSYIFSGHIDYKCVFVA